MLSHELRNPLAAVIAATRVMRNADAAAGVMSHARSVIERQAAHMSRLLDDLLDVSRITRGGIELKPEDLDLRDVVRAALEAIDPLLHTRRSDLTVELPEVPVPVRGDPVRLQQVVANLLSNATRYSLPGSPIRLQLALGPEGVVLTVADQGRGIEREMLSAIFELFVQARQGLDRASGGLGVGLTLVRTIVEQHGGTVQAHSDGPGTGSTFTVRLPIGRFALDTPSEREGSASRRIVLVEDQADTRSMLRLLLEVRGHQVFEASDGPSAIALIERERPDIALVDIGLPAMDGYEVARRIRRQPELQSVFLVALTGYGTADDMRIAYAAGFDAHLTKPAEPARIEEIVERRRPR